MSAGKIKILFLCTGNSCRSQMAEGFAKYYFPHLFEVFSAGTKPEKLNPIAVKVMKEIGIDISKQYSKNVKQLMDIDFDYVITLCGDAKENCPIFPKKTKNYHQGFKDPAKAKGSDEEIINVYRTVRDEIKNFILSLPEFLKIKVQN
jgi:arsenate reductase